MKYLAAFTSSASLEGFRLPEFLSVAATLDVPVTVLDDSIPWINKGGDRSWFSVFESPASLGCLQKLAARCMLLRGIYILYESAPTLEDLYACLDTRMDTGDGAATLAVPSSSSPSSSLSPSGPVARAFLGERDATRSTSSATYCYQVETIGKKYTGKAKQAVMQAILQRQPLKGTVEWRQPRRCFYVFIQHAVENAVSGAKEWRPNGPLLRVFHCCLCAESRRSQLLATYDLKRRPYIGTTSMPPEESMVMANMSHVHAGHFTYDPFCGTGSLLVAAAHCGAKTFGSDADGRAMRAGTAKGKVSPQMQQQRRLALATYTEAELTTLAEEERTLPSMWTNFKLYRLPPPDRVRMNFSAWEHTWHTTSSGGIFDSIISDPPYGLREPRKKVDAPEASVEGSCSGSHSEEPSRAAVTLSAYSTNEVVLDLVVFAATRLVLGGRLTFWHPTTDHYTDDELPSHPSLRIVHNIPQRLSLKIVRRLIVMEKVCPVPQPSPSRAACAPRKSADDLRLLMDTTALPDNVDYTHYRAKRERKRAAAQQYKATQAAADEDATAAVAGNRRGRKSSRVDGQEAIVANRQRNIAAREAKQAASHVANAAHKAGPERV